MLLKKANGTSYTDSEFQNELYNSLREAQNDNNLFFAPRTWKEAGKIIEITKETRNNIPCVAIILAKRIRPITPRTSARYFKIL